MGYSWVAGAPKFSKDGPITARWNKRPLNSRRRLLREKGRRSKTTWVVTDHATSPGISTHRSDLYASSPRVARTWPVTITAYWRSRRTTRRRSGLRVAIGDLPDGSGSISRHRLFGIGIAHAACVFDRAACLHSTRFSLQRLIGKFGSGGHYEGICLAGAIPRGTSPAARTQPQDKQRIRLCYQHRVTCHC
jgi:hypothetical protein